MSLGGSCRCPWPWVGKLSLPDPAPGTIQTPSGPVMQQRPQSSARLMYHLSCLSLQGFAVHYAFLGQLEPSTQAERDPSPGDLSVWGQARLDEQIAETSVLGLSAGWAVPQGITSSPWNKSLQHHSTSIAGTSCAEEANLFEVHPQGQCIFDGREGCLDAPCPQQLMQKLCSRFPQVSHGKSRD